MATRAPVIEAGAGRARISRGRSGRSQRPHCQLGEGREQTLCRAYRTGYDEQALSWFRRQSDSQGATSEPTIGVIFAVSAPVSIAY